MDLELLRTFLEVASIELCLVSIVAGHSTEQAPGQGCVMVDLGAFAQALEHRRTFPDAPESRTRLGQGKMALALQRELGGAACLPWRMVEEDVRAARLHLVDEGPRMSLTAHAVYPVRSGRESLILQLLRIFDKP